MSGYRSTLIKLLVLALIVSACGATNPLVPLLSSALDLRWVRNLLASELVLGAVSPSCRQQIEAIISGDPSQSRTLANLAEFTTKDLGEMGDYEGCARAGSRHILVAIKITPGIPCTTAVGICGPMECTEDDYSSALKAPIVSILPKVLPLLGIPVVGRYWVDQDSVEFIDTKARSEKHSSPSTLAVVFFVAVGALLLIQIAASFYDYFFSKGSFAAAPASVGEKVATSLSLVRNLKLMVYADHPLGQEFNAFHGIAGLMMMWMVSAHICFYLSTTPTVNILDQNTEIQDNPMLQIMIAGEYAVDVLMLTFAFVATVILLPMFMGEEQKGALYTLAMTAKLGIRKYLRQTLMYAGFLAFVVAIVPMIDTESPLSGLKEWLIEPCKADWQYNLLYVSNFAAPTYSCIPWSWYPAADFQFLLVTPVILYVYAKSRRAGFGLLAALFAASVAVQVCLIVHYGLSYSYLYNRETQFDYYNVMPYVRITSHLMGIGWAWLYLSYTRKGSVFELPRANAMLDYWINAAYIRIPLYFVGLVITLGNFWLTYWFDHYRSDVRVGHDIAMLIFSRVAFCLGTVLVLFPVLLGKARVLNSVLSCGFWAILAKSTMAAYLINSLLIVMERTGEMHGGYLTNSRSIFNSMHTTFITYLYSIGFTVLLEAPAAWLVHHFVFSELSPQIYPAKATDIPKY